MKAQLTVLGLLVAAMAACYFLMQPGKAHPPKLLVTDTYSTESTYRKIEVRDCSISYTYAPDGCKRSGTGEFRKEDLKTVDRLLGTQDVGGLIMLINLNNFQKLGPSYSDGSGGTTYPEKITSSYGGRVKEITYRGRPDAEQVPPVFRKVREKLMDMVWTNCHVRCK
jgi:hypothetical protein